MRKKTLLAFGSILCGLVLIAGGLGYTVTQASLYSLSTYGSQPDLAAANDAVRDPNVWQPYDHRTDEATPAPAQGWYPQKANPNPEGESADLFMPALSLLSGAGFAVLGALTLAHRMRGVN